MNPIKLEIFVGKKECGHWTSKVAVTWKGGSVTEICAPEQFCWPSEDEAREAAKDIQDRFLQRLEANREVRNANPNLH